MSAKDREMIDKLRQNLGRWVRLGTAAAELVAVREQAPADLGLGPQFAASDKMIQDLLRAVRKLADGQANAFEDLVKNLETQPGPDSAKPAEKAG